MEKKELDKLNTEYVEHLNTMDALCERMRRNYLYMDNFAILHMAKTDMTGITEILLFNMLRQESVFELFRKCVETAAKVRTENPAWLQELIEKDNEVQTQYAVDSLLKSNGMKRKGQ
ncbi:hypothetical protein O3680_08090 [Prevotella melaninogenica]|uniref:hypothetical protein n=1 Tax=Prevotella melaninogenica TaxID=28132 RepID=UPI00352C0379